MKKLSLQELNRVDAATFRQQPKTPVVLVLDNIRSGHNVGSAFRTADAFALEKIYLCGITARPPHREILKTAIGASESVDWEYVAQTKELVPRLKEEGYEIWAVEQAAESKKLPDFKWTSGNKYALIFGNEVKGVDQKVMDLVSHCIEVPQFGTKHSLNISVCIGVVVWEYFRQWKFL